MSESYDAFFHCATGFAPYEWQRQVANRGLPELLPVPTGFGKTEGAVLAWAWRWSKGLEEPRHLVYCLPVRTLVRQTVERLRRYFSELKSKEGLDIAVYQLMGGVADDEWASYPERPWVLVGTQDQLLSRALNRGYSMSRFDWPVHFGLLNQDCRWIVDEVQLMGPGLWTTAQLDWMRRKRFKSIKPCFTTWMSATMDASFLATTDRKAEGCDRASVPGLTFDDSPLRTRGDAIRRIQWFAKDDPSDIAKAVQENHSPGTLTLVVCNTVESAREIYEALSANTEKILLTSRFRRGDRDSYERLLLDFEELRRRNKGKPIPGHSGLICVSTQVVEAGVDISAHRLWSEVAPWPSIVQRLGRLNRDGLDADARAWFWRTSAATGEGKTRKKQEQVGPYDVAHVQLAVELLDKLVPLSGRSFGEALKKLEQRCAAKLARALAARPGPIPRALDVHGLFSTERDVHGGFTDVSAFVRSTDPELDLTVFWRDWEGGPKKPPPSDEKLDGPPLIIADEGCPVPFYRLRDALKTSKHKAWIWNEDEDTWESIRPDELRPGMVVMLHRDAGGYNKRLGWTGSAADRLEEVPRAGRGRALREDQRTEIGFWVKLAVHLADARKKAEGLCDQLKLEDPLRKAVVEAAAWHDLGKAHRQWQEALPAAALVTDEPLAKCPRVLGVDLLPGWNVRRKVCALVSGLRPHAIPLPDEQKERDGRPVTRLRWALEESLKRDEVDQLRSMDGVRWAGHVRFRPRLRHEAASALAMWHWYCQGPAPFPALAVYLAAAHHGKVRTVFRSLTKGGEDAFGVPPQPDALDYSGQRWPLDFSVALDGAEGMWADGQFLLSNHGWTGLVADLLGPWKPGERSSAGVVPENEPKALGPFALAYLEALVRVADWRASDDPSTCVRLEEVADDG